MAFYAFHSFLVEVQVHTSYISAGNARNNKLGPVVRTRVSAYPGLNFNPGFFFFLPKALSWIIFSIFFSISNHQIVGTENSTELAF